MANSPSQIDTQIVDVQSSEVESQLSSLVYDMSQQVHMVMQNMLKMIAEIDQNSSGIMEEVEKCKNLAFERKKSLEEEKDQIDAFAVLDMLNDRD
ncbi:hypothetical protein CICLE_v10010030mg [Citrus x clementina]|uniref:Uncharacterized protein n=1 Tax=Citrus clementina TaxID=85681 RepID=V4UCS0_CITCL|nr:uncharacterized protein LOC18055077 [Citrus x clementina]ESR63831.1 hypothetical protein CICLE_v10010030mg [Citrus x clementina]ESR63832.1 hypothetical protein CICLE_v10010030mg [Citrus x clementina]